MYAVSNVNRVYISFLLCLCAAFLFAPSLANANEYWSVLEKRWIPSETVPNSVKEMLGHEVKRPTGTNISVASQPTYTTNPTGGLSATTNNILRNMGQPSTFSSTVNQSLNSAKTALKSCVRSPSCAGRTLGGGAIIYDGIRGWKEVYDLTLGDDDQIYKPAPDQFPQPNDRHDIVPPYDDSLKTSRYKTVGYGVTSSPRSNPTQHSPPANTTIVAEVGTANQIQFWWCTNASSGLPLVGFTGSLCEYDDTINPPEFTKPPQLIPVSPSELDNLIDEGYEPAVSDAPVIFLSDTQPESITLSTPAPVQLPSTTTTNTSSSGTTTTVSNRTINYTVSNNSTPNPSINSSVTETTTTYDENSNIMSTSTSTTTEEGVQSDAPTAGASADIELPVFCAWAKPLCDWLGWTQEELGEEEPDLSQLITVFEPDEDGFDVGIGSGSCPAPMMLNLGIINKTVEVKYDPFCSFLEMIRPFVLAAAYLFAAYLYIGVLKRG